MGMMGKVTATTAAFALVVVAFVSPVRADGFGDFLKDPAGTINKATQGLVDGVDEAASKNGIDLPKGNPTFVGTDAGGQPVACYKTTKDGGPDPNETPIFARTSLTAERAATPGHNGYSEIGGLIDAATGNCASMVKQGKMRAVGQNANMAGRPRSGGGATRYGVGNICPRAAMPVTDPDGFDYPQGHKNYGLVTVGATDIASIQKFGGGPQYNCNPNAKIGEDPFSPLLDHQYNKSKMFGISREDSKRRADIANARFKKDVEAQLGALKENDASGPGSPAGSSNSFLGIQLGN